MAELVDAPASGAGARKGVEVRVLFWAPFTRGRAAGSEAMMSLRADLIGAKTEEDVKDAYIKALGLKSYSKNLVDIQTQEVWFEAKDAPTPSIVMFAQLLFYIRAAKKRGEAIPAFLTVIDREKAAIMPTEKALPLLDDI
jgi:hypothetical protein